MNGKKYMDWHSIFIPYIAFAGFVFIFVFLTGLEVGRGQELQLTLCFLSALKIAMSINSFVNKYLLNRT